jgi:hypothetical protein
MAPTRGRLEGRITVPTGGWTLTVNDSGAGGGVTATMPAGTYFWSSPDFVGGGTQSFVAAFVDALNLAAPTDTLAATLDAGELGTGTFTLTSSGTTTVTWLSTDLRDLLGFAANLSAGTSWTGPSQVRSLWLPSCPYNAPNQIDATFRGWREADYRGQENAAGYVWAHMGQQKIVAWLRWASVERAKVWEANETTANASFERFAQDAIWGVAAWGTAGGPVRFYPDAADSDVWATYMVPDFRRIEPQPYHEGWVGGPWRIELPRLVLIPFEAT